MAGAKNHDYHILPPSILAAHRRRSRRWSWRSGGIMWMHGARACGGWVFFARRRRRAVHDVSAGGRNVIKEAHAGDHTPVVQLHLRYGMILFIASEVMFFVGWFWAFFDFSLFPAAMTFADGTVDARRRGRRGDRRAVAAQGPRGDQRRSNSRCSTR